MLLALAGRVPGYSIQCQISSSVTRNGSGIQPELLEDHLDLRDQTLGFVSRRSDFVHKAWDHAVLGIEDVTDRRYKSGSKRRDLSSSRSFTLLLRDDGRSDRKGMTRSLNQPAAADSPGFPLNDPVPRLVCLPHSHDSPWPGDDRFASSNLQGGPLGVNNQFSAIATIPIYDGTVRLYPF